MGLVNSPEYRLGWEWAKEHGPIITELFTSTEMATTELRTRLFGEAARKWPSQRDDISNDLKQTAFVAGAMQAVAETMPMTREALAAVFDAALDIGMMWSAEAAKAEHLDSLKARPVGWWRRKFGDARPIDVVNALSVTWRKEWAEERGRAHPGSKWAVLIDMLGSRELAVLDELERIEELQDGAYTTYEIIGKDGSFQIIARPVYQQGRLTNLPGEIVG